MEETLAKVQKIIQEEVERAGLQVRRILLFGCRARGEARPDTDWDFYVIIAPHAPREARREIALIIRRRLSSEGLCADLCVQSESVVQERIQDPGYLTYYALQEGIKL